MFPSSGRLLFMFGRVTMCRSTGFYHTRVQQKIVEPSTYTRLFRRFVSEKTVTTIDGRTENGLPYTPEELLPGPIMINRIVSDLKSTGVSFTLPISNTDIMEEMASPLAKLIQLGVSAEFIIEGCVKKPNLFRHLMTKGETILEILNVMVNSGHLSYEDSLRIFSSYDNELLSVLSIGVQSRIDALISCGISSQRIISRIIRLCPATLFGRESHEMRKLAESLSAFFSRKEISAIISCSPGILQKNIEEIEEKYEYIYYQMCIEGDQFKDCINWVDMELDDIISRHELLLQTGRYTTPDAKRPQSKMENASLSRILDSNDEHFAVQVAGITLEEWIIFRSIYDIKRDHGEQSEKRFEKVKPSMRKAFERRRKEKLDNQPHIFDMTTNTSH